MHELSIAQSLYEMVQRHTPAGGLVRRVRVKAGPMRGIEPQSLQWAWQAVLQTTQMNGAVLELDLPRWRLKCDQCGREWDSDDLYVSCDCGHPRPSPQGGDDLILLSMDVDLPE
jgi:hydrogenase nickel incorporation protein HypA/HybF